MCRRQRAHQGSIFFLLFAFTLFYIMMGSSSDFTKPPLHTCLYPPADRVRKTIKDHSAVGEEDEHDGCRLISLSS